MNPIDRVMTALSFKEPDRVPLIHSLTIYGAKELGISIKDYFSNPLNIVEAQVLMQKKYRNDCFIGVMYGSVEIEAFGGSTHFFDDGPPNAAAPVINTLKDIENLKVPEIEACNAMQNNLQAIKLLKEESNNNIPILGLAISPFSLPIMQMGFEKYLDLIVENPTMFWKLMEVNKQFSVNWANKQLEAGVTAIGYLDPFSSPAIITKDMYMQTGWKIAKEVVAQIKGPTATHYSSAIAIPNIDEIAQTGATMFAVSSEENIGQAKQKANGRMAVLGNLNGIEMCRWDVKDAENAVKQIINQAAEGGGLVISDAHGEIPYQVPEKILHAISNAVEKYGKY